MEEDITIFNRGMSAESVIRIGDKVHRTKSSNYKFVHSVLLHLEQSNFIYSPRFLGFDKDGREIVSFIEGTVPREFPLTLKQKIDAIKILRNLHDLLAKSKIKGKNETVCHNDFAPWNIIINNHKVVGIIDFDESAPGNRIDDLAYFIWTFLELGTSENSTKLQVENIAQLVEAYGPIKKENLIDAILKQQIKILSFRNHMVISSKDSFKRAFSKNAIIEIQKSINWVNSNKHRIEIALSLGINKDNE